MKLKELLDKYPNDNEIINEIKRLYPDHGVDGYPSALSEIRNLDPVDDELTIHIEHVVQDWTTIGQGIEEYEDVHGANDGEVYEEDENTPPALIGKPIKWALEMNQWTNWLGMTLDQESIDRLGELTFLAHCLWEMTFCGYDQKTIDEHNAELDRRYEEIKSGKSDLYEMVKDPETDEYDFIKIPDEDHPYRNKE